MLSALLNVFILLGCICSSLAIDIIGCGSNKTCAFSTDGCSASDPTCLIFTSSWNATQNAFYMEISGGSGNGNQYVAVAFSPNNKMENSDLYYCTGDDLKSGAIQTRHFPPNTASSLPSEITNPAPTTNSGVAMCSFTRAASVTKTVSGGAVRAFDLSTTPFHILLAVGQYSNGLRQHAFVGRFSSGPYNFTNAQVTAETAPVTEAPPLTRAPGSSGSRNTDGCGTTKGCFINPSACVPGATNCMFASWVYDSEDDAFDIEIIGGAGAEYAAVAFAGSGQMRDADLYYCTAAGLTSGVIRARQTDPIVLSTPTEISNEANSVIDGSVTCSFRRSPSVSKIISSGPADFNIKENNYFLLYAFGSFAGGVLNQHSFNGKVASTSAINFTQSSGSSGGSAGNKGDLIKAHACFMIIAWLTCASIGAIIARHFKPLWHDSTCFGEKVWFQLHRSLMIAVLLCTILAFIFIFVANEGEYSSSAGAHPVLGIMVTCLVIINPVMALFRPHPGEPKRVVFNWAHWLVGSVARIFGLVAIFLGVDLGSLDIPEWDTWALVAFVVIHIVTEVVLELISAHYGHIAVYKKSETEQFPLSDNEAPRNLPPKGATIKYVILLIYSVVNVAFLLAFIITIGGHQ